MDTKKNVDLSTMGRLKKRLKLKNCLHRNDFKTSSVSWDENRKKTLNFQNPQPNLLKMIFASAHL